jgi:site-specific DNA-methyltransferase (adenine-specific)
MGSFCKCDVPERKHIMAQNHHPTVKPLKLLSYLITLGSREGDLVLDPFVGSGTTYIAATQLHRACIGIELNPEYLEIAKARVKPLLEQTKIV